MSLLKVCIVIMEVNLDFLLDWNTICQGCWQRRIISCIFFISAFELKNKKTRFLWNLKDKRLIKVNKDGCIELDFRIKGIVDKHDRIIKIWPIGYFGQFKEIKDLVEISDFAGANWLILFNGIGDLKRFWVSKDKNYWSRSLWVPLSSDFLFLFAPGIFGIQRWCVLIFDWLEMHGVGHSVQFLDLMGRSYEWQLKIDVGNRWCDWT